MEFSEALNVFKQNKGLPSKIKACGVIEQALSDYSFVDIKGFNKAILSGCPTTAQGKTITDQKEFSADDIFDILDNFVIKH